MERAMSWKIVLTSAALTLGLAAAAGAADWDDERAVRTFEKLDADNSGGIDLVEFRAGTDSSVDRADSYFRRLDANDDGLVSYRELRAEWDLANNVLREDVYKLDAEAQAKVMEGAYITIDTDGDGSISRAEFDAAVKPSAGSDRAHHEFDRTDDNNDDQLSRSEFREDWGRFRRDLRSEVLYPPSARRNLPLSHRQELTFEAIDLDRDGWLDEDEYRASLNARAAGRASATFRAMDDNRDGLLSRAEVYEEWDQLRPSLNPRITREDAALGVERRTIIERRTVIESPSLFHELDLNADGRVTLREYRAGIGVGRSAAALRFDRLDRNGDGLLSRAEMDADLRPLPPVDARVDPEVDYDGEVEVEIDD